MLSLGGEEHNWECSTSPSAALPHKHGFELAFYLVRKRYILKSRWELLASWEIIKFLETYALSTV